MTDKLRLTDEDKALVALIQSVEERGADVLPLFADGGKLAPIVARMRAGSLAAPVQNAFAEFVQSDPELLIELSQRAYLMFGPDPGSDSTH